MMDSLTTIRDYQLLVDRSIRHLGGYWRTLSGLARVIEELGEVAELLEANELHQEDMDGELADVFIISTCLANQFAADLVSEYNKIGLPAEVAQITYEGEGVPATTHYFKLVQTAGQLARILNHYDGDKVMKKGEQKQSVCSIIARFHQHLYACAHALNSNLFNEVAETLKKNIKRDKHRFAITADPVTEPTVDRYKQVKQMTSTVFEQGTRFWGASPWKEEISVQENLYQFAASIRRFEKCSSVEGLDAFVMEIPKQLAVTSEVQDFIKRLEQWQVSIEEGGSFDYLTIS